MLKKVLFVLVLIAVFSPIYAQGNGGDPIITIDSIIGAITPLIIFAITWVVQKIKPTLVGWNIVWVIIPLLSLAATIALQMIEASTSFWGQFAWNFLSVVVAQLIIQLQGEKKLQNEKQKKLAKANNL